MENLDDRWQIERWRIKIKANFFTGGGSMAKATLGGVDIEIDEDGFIQEPDKWNKDVAEDLAKTENASPMGEEHWKLVNYLRDYYVKFGIAPPIRMVVKQTGIDLKKIYVLFPGGPAKGACKVAGLPKPTGCV